MFPSKIHRRNKSRYGKTYLHNNVDFIGGVTDNKTRDKELKIGSLFFVSAN